jgi:hypothetical protein
LTAFVRFRPLTAFNRPGTTVLVLPVALRTVLNPSRCSFFENDESVSIFTFSATPH